MRVGTRSVHARETRMQSRHGRQNKNSAHIEVAAANRAEDPNVDGLGRVHAAIDATQMHILGHTRRHRQRERGGLGIGALLVKFGLKREALW